MPLWIWFVFIAYPYVFFFCSYAILYFFLFFFTMLCDTSGIIILRPWDIFGISLDVCWYRVWWRKPRIKALSLIYYSLLLIHNSLGDLSSVILPAAHLLCISHFFVCFCLSLCPICGSFSPTTVMYVKPAAVYTTSEAKHSHGEISQLWWQLWFRDRNGGFWAHFCLFRYTMH